MRQYLCLDDVQKMVSAFDTDDISGGEGGDSWYGRQIERFSVPTEDEERKLLVRSFAGDAAARSELAERNLRFSRRVATKFFHVLKPRSLSLDDFIQAGNIGLIEAIRKFDPEKYATRLSSYAGWWIMKSILAAFCFEERHVRYPLRVENRLSKLRSFQKNFLSMNGRNPTVSEISVSLKLPESDIRMLLILDLGTLSLDASPEASEIDDENICLADLFLVDYTHPESILMKIEAGEWARHAADCVRTRMSEFEVAVLEYRGEPHRTHQESVVFRARHSISKESLYQYGERIRRDAKKLLSEQGLVEPHFFSE